jgi:phosphoribosylamine--glycine ligase
MRLRSPLIVVEGAPLRVLVVGGGGREHALCWHLAKHSPGVEVYCAPGNPGIAAIAETVAIRSDEVSSLAELARDLAIDLTIVGPELPLALGIVDAFERFGLRVFGPRQAAARLESSKVFAKEFMRRHDIPTPDFDVVYDGADARRAISRHGLPVALKADGLAAGKGVLLVRTEQELAAALSELFEVRRFGSAAERVVVEPLIEGEEVSFIGISDGRHLLPLATSKDYKRIGDDDSGPNTGGMGAHSPSGLVGPELAREILERVMVPTVAAMATEGTPLVGFLYAGLMLTEKGPQVLEFNVRLGDPEAQVLLLRLDEDLARLLLRGAQGDFGVRRLSFRREAAACLVLAAAGYPETPVRGDVIEGLERAVDREGAVLFHGATRRDGERIVVDGGRVLNVCATGPDLRVALRRCYEAAREIEWPGMQMRGDVGRRVLEADVLRSGTMELPVVTDPS